MYKEVLFGSSRTAMAILLNCFFLHSVQSHGEYGVLVVSQADSDAVDKRATNVKAGQSYQNSTWTETSFCVVYFPGLVNVSYSRDEAQRFPISKLKDLNLTNVCNDGDDLSSMGLESTFPLFASNLSYANCSLGEKVENLQKYNVLGALSDGAAGSKFNDSLFDVSVPFGALLERNARTRLLALQKAHPRAEFYLYQREEKRFDLSLLVILLLAVTTVMLGSLWSGYVKQNLRIRRQCGEMMRRECGRRSKGGRSGNGRDGKGDCEGEEEGEEEEEEEEELSVRVSPLLVMFFVFCMCSMLMLLYFFFDQLVYVIIVMFCTASTLAMYSCLEPIVLLSYLLPLPIIRFPRLNLWICKIQMELRQLLLLILSISTSVVWFVFRKQDWSWILQDFLGVMFSINMLKVLRLPSLRICTCLLCALFFYDIFFVFITPLFMKDGESVMVKVATGHSSDEQLPMVLKVPHLNSDPCSMNTYSLLGFGDILVPGLLLSFCHGYDLMAKTPCKLYWILTSVTYTLGLIATFISLFLMNAAQPALLYLVPFTLIPTFLVAWIRGDLHAMWVGDLQTEAQDYYENVNGDGGDQEDKEEEVAAPDGRQSSQSAPGLQSNN